MAYHVLPSASASRTSGSPGWWSPTGAGSPRSGIYGALYPIRKCRRCGLIEQRKARTWRVRLPDPTRVPQRHGERSHETAVVNDLVQDSARRQTGVRVPAQSGPTARYPRGVAVIFDIVRGRVMARCVVRASAASGAPSGTIPCGSGIMKLHEVLLFGMVARRFGIGGQAGAADGLSVPLFLLAGDMKTDAPGHFRGTPPGGRGRRGEIQVSPPSPGHDAAAAPAGCGSRRNQRRWLML